VDVGAGSVRGYTYFDYEKHKKRVDEILGDRPVSMAPPKFVEWLAADLMHQFIERISGRVPERTIKLADKLVERLRDLKSTVAKAEAHHIRLRP
jgi:hypothetical protein